MSSRGAFFEFFVVATGCEPYDYQRRLAEEMCAGGADDEAAHRGPQGVGQGVRRAWRHAGPALEEQHWRELQKLDDDTARGMTLDLFLARLRHWWVFHEERGVVGARP